jgi:3-oxoacyl-[acyl-carrier-protein] synthase III
MQKVKILGMGKAVGSRKVNNEELERRIGAEEGWIYKSTGILSRQYVDADKGENALTLGTEAAIKAVENSGISLEDIDCIIGANGSPMQGIPCAASIFQREIGMGKSGIPCFDVDTTCYSFAVALMVASNLIENNLYRNILIISSDAPSSALGYATKEVQALFGDGAAAAVVSKSNQEDVSEINYFSMNTYSEGNDLTAVKGLGTMRHPNNPNSTPEDHTFHMSGKQIFRYAIKHMPAFFDNFFANSSSKQSNLKYIIPHQTTKHGIDIFQKFGFTESQIASHIETHGNCIAASIPMLLHDLISEQKVERGDSILLFGTSAGFSVGGLSLTY